MGRSLVCRMAWQWHGQKKQPPCRQIPASRPAPTLWPIPTLFQGMGALPFVTNGPGRDTESCHDCKSDGQPGTAPNILCSPYATNNHRYQTKLFLEVGVHSGLVTSRTSSRLVLSKLEENREETNVNGSTRRGSGSRLERFLVAPIPAQCVILTRDLGSYMHLLVSRGVKNSECLGVASSHDIGGALLILN